MVEVVTVTVLFARADSVYKYLPDYDVWDEQRNALNWHGGSPVVAHPPCRAWGRLRKLANPAEGEKELARWAVAQVREYGGVLEHPAGSTLWADQGLPLSGEIDKYGGYTLPVDQFWWGHKARKRTFLYIVRCPIEWLPVFPMRLGEATHVCGSPGRRRDGSRLRKGDPYWRPEITKAEREATPVLFALWLCEVAKRCKQQ